MKELDYEDWQKNPTPRKMWVWDDYEENEQDDGEWNDQFT